MKTCGFTLVELLAVIVILAIIALISIPITLNIINTARVSSSKSSIKLYGKAVELAIKESKLTDNPVLKGNLSEAFLSTIEYSGGRVSCATNKLYEDGNIYLAACKVNGKDVPYEYGEYQQVYKPQYYGLSSNPVDYTVGEIGDNAPANPSTVPPTDEDYYVGYDVANGKISAGYVCFTRNGKEYCLKGLGAVLGESSQVITPSPYYQTNANIIYEALAGETGAICASYSHRIYCSISGLVVYAYNDGYVNAYDNYYRCWVKSDNGVKCFRD